MSISTCKYCDKMYDQDYDVEHEDVCKQDRIDDAWDRMPQWVKDWTMELQNERV